MSIKEFIVYKAGYKYQSLGRFRQTELEELPTGNNIGTRTPAKVQLSSILNGLVNTWIDGGVG